ncbi:MAG: C4-type zinc ribbon domain-containing protein [Spirochaetales bacterium]|uniref:zinc ribbon domain-containing protein n=1 Tax=Bullifex sp. TaxID=2815808 RepID=UPI002A54A34D|nr:C4-type zinc ribbon domain-containing protein [Bullifex sp.]MDD5972429.1 C4-type zinc ribbon domain-containing protein [Spirochaetales bacterium]MDD7271058.1 C4-type zinc ribbon domain-containing protein [Spirochaetales bacterium]MDY4068057.1 C4-type zinc ribbon domain-containing protein [Bullifex sp.]
MADNNIQQIDSLLLTLQDVLRLKFELESEIESLPENLKTQKEELAEANKKFLELNEKYTKAKEDAASNSIRYDEAFQTRTNAEKMMDTISTQREYEALSKQIDEAKIKETGLLKARNAATALVEELKAQLDAQSKVCDEIKADVDAKSAEIDSIILEKKEQIAELDRRCLQVKEQGISDEIYAKFCNIVKNKKGVGIVAIHGQVCQGCHMVLPVQFVNDVRMGNTTEYCPYCSRILYYEESEDSNIDYSVDSFGEDSDDESFADVVDTGDFDDLL